MRELVLIARFPIAFVVLVALGGSVAFAQAPEPESPAAVPAADPGTVPPDAPAPVPGAANERLIAQRLALSRFDVEMLWLDTPDGAFLALHRPSDEAVPYGGLVIVSTPGSVVDYAPVPHALSRVAAAGGWSVLSLQPAVADSAPAATAARIAAAVTYFSGIGLQNIVLIGDTGGATRALAGDLPPAIVGFVGVGAWESDLAGRDVAILDIAGTRDARAMRWQQQRQATARTYSNSIEAATIDGAGPDFYGYAEQTARLIRGWLQRAAPAQVVSR